MNSAKPFSTQQWKT